jgi:hypothetical protein
LKSKREERREPEAVPTGLLADGIQGKGSLLMVAVTFVKTSYFTRTMKEEEE